MEQWIKIVSQFGIPIALLMALGIFLVRQVWPVFKQRMADADKERQENTARLIEQGRLFTESLQKEREYNTRRFEEQGKIFAEVMRTQQVLAAETHKESMKSQYEITRELKSLNNYLRNGHK